MKRYLVFACEQYYPAGGWGDFVGAFETLIEAKKAEQRSEKKGYYTHIVDLKTLDYVVEPRPGTIGSNKELKV
jgi:hypothetical protein